MQGREEKKNRRLLRFAVIGAGLMAVFLSAPLQAYAKTASGVEGCYTDIESGQGDLCQDIGYSWCKSGGAWKCTSDIASGSGTLNCETCEWSSNPPPAPTVNCTSSDYDCDSASISVCSSSAKTQSVSCPMKASSKNADGSLKCIKNGTYQDSYQYTQSCCTWSCGYAQNCPNDSSQDVTQTQTCSAATQCNNPNIQAPVPATRVCKRQCSTASGSADYTGWNDAYGACTGAEKKDVGGKLALVGSQSRTVRKTGDCIGNNIVQNQTCCSTNSWSCTGLPSCPANESAPSTVSQACTEGATVCSSTPLGSMENPAESKQCGATCSADVWECTCNPENETTPLTCSKTIDCNGVDTPSPATDEDKKAECLNKSGILPSGSAGQTLRHSGLAWRGDSFLFNYKGTEQGVEVRRIGIGTIAPTERLEISGSGNGQIGRIVISEVDADQSPGVRLRYGFEKIDTTDYSKHWEVFVNKGNDNALTFWGANTVAEAGTGGSLKGGDRLVMTRDGRVGIGKTPDAGYALDVSGKAKASEFCIGATCVKNWDDVGLWQKSANGADIFKSNAGNVGIGTTTPVTPLQIVSTTRAFLNSWATSTVGAPVSVSFGARDDFNATANTGFRGGIISVDTADPLTFSTDNTLRQVITRYGDVLIGSNELSRESSARLLVNKSAKEGMGAISRIERMLPQSGWPGAGAPLRARLVGVNSNFRSEMEEGDYVRASANAMEEIFRVLPAQQGASNPSSATQVEVEHVSGQTLPEIPAPNGAGAGYVVFKKGDVFRVQRGGGFFDLVVDATGRVAIGGPHPQSLVQPYSLYVAGNTFASGFCLPGSNPPCVQKWDDVGLWQKSGGNIVNGNSGNVQIKGALVMEPGQKFGSGRSFGCGGCSNSNSIELYNSGSGALTLSTENVLRMQPKAEGPTHIGSKGTYIGNTLDGYYFSNLVELMHPSTALLVKNTLDDTQLVGSGQTSLRLSSSRGVSEDVIHVGVGDIVRIGSEAREITKIWNDFGGGSKDVGFETGVSGTSTFKQNALVQAYTNAPVRIEKRHIAQLLGYDYGTKFVFNTNGNLGVGTTSPAGLIHVASGGKLVYKLIATRVNATVDDPVFNQACAFDTSDITQQTPPAAAPEESVAGTFCIDKWGNSRNGRLYRNHYVITKTDGDKTAFLVTKDGDVQAAKSLRVGGSRSRYELADGNVVIPGSRSELEQKLPRCTFESDMTSKNPPHPLYTDDRADWSFCFDQFAFEPAKQIVQIYQKIPVSVPSFVATDNGRVAIGREQYTTASLQVNNAASTVRYVFLQVVAAGLSGQTKSCAFDNRSGYRDVPTATAFVDLPLNTVCHDDFFESYLPKRALFRVVTAPSVPGLLVASDGKVGIGTADPTARLQVDAIGIGELGFSKGSYQIRTNHRLDEDTPIDGTKPSWATVLGGSGADEWGVWRKAPDGGAWSNSFRINSIGNVGIGGFLDPGQLRSKLTIYDPQVGNGLQPLLKVASTGGNSPAIDLGDDGTFWRVAFINQQYGGNGETLNRLRIQPITTDDMKTAVDETGGASNGITILTNGKVGIGTQNPWSKLDVNNGDINVSYLGKELARVNERHRLALANDRVGLDIAELYETQETVEVGDVLVAGGRERVLLKSSKPYEPVIVGIVSGAPALLFEGSDLKIGAKPDRFIKGTRPPVAIAGRVPVKVSVENGPVRVGDYLTSSSRPGVAMRATEPGMALGIALENYAGPTDGTVLVFLNIGEKNIAKKLRELEAQVRELKEKGAKTRK